MGKTILILQAKIKFLMILTILLGCVTLVNLHNSKNLLSENGKRIVLSLKNIFHKIGYLEDFQHDKEANLRLEFLTLAVPLKDSILFLKIIQIIEQNLSTNFYKYLKKLLKIGPQKLTLMFNFLLLLHHQPIQHKKANKYSKTKLGFKKVKCSIVDLTIWMNHQRLQTSLCGMTQEKILTIISDMIFVA